ncbi:MAG: carbohydrate-binding domain-containing protein [Massiliimalia sp.]|jgi:hypothetical protein
MKKRTILCLFLALTFACYGCGTGNSQAANESTSSNITNTAETMSAVSTSEMFTDRDMEIGYDEQTGVPITLSENSISCDSSAVQISGTTATITEEGTYILSGTLTNGMIIIDAEDTDKIQLVLDNAEITSTTSAAIYVKEADKVFVTTAPESNNLVANGGEYLAIDDNNIDAAIFSKSDITLNGSGTLTISAAAGHGVVSKDDLALTSGTYTITSAEHGLSGKDSVRISGGTFQIVSGKDGIHAENTDDTSLGFVYLCGGTFDITSEGDGLSAGAYLQIEDGTFAITTGSGSASVSMSSSTANVNPHGMPETESTTTEDTDTVSQKGLKSDGNITISNGTFSLDTADDSIHAGGDILIAQGKFDLRSGDDAVHSDKAVTIQNGSFTIPYCYEGIEGLSVTVENGTFDITSQDDGINAAGGADSSGFGGAQPQQEQFSSNSDSFIVINGGTFSIISTGDCIDSNGDLTINGGTLNLTCNNSGNTALDTDGTYTNNGGDVTTNDGSENNPGGMGGQKGGGHARGGF